MTRTLDVGAIGGGAEGLTLSLPLDAVAQTFAVVGIRGAGKTITATVMAEEMCKNGLPWIALDPVSVWWGLRATPEGKPGGYPVVVIGGKHGDLPLETGAGKKIARALVSENVCAVIDLKLESKGFWHRFVTDFSLELLDLEPDTARHVFIEEAPEFVPQKTKVELTLRCKEAVERLVRLGRNSGYGCTLISQRSATVDKDVLSQCENLFLLRLISPHDRKAIRDWVEEKKDENPPRREHVINDMTTLPDGTAWFWSPQWLKKVCKVKIRERETFHPGATRKVGQQARPVALSNVGHFVERLGRLLTKTTTLVTTASEPANAKAETPAPPVVVDAHASCKEQIEKLRGENALLLKQVQEMSMEQATIIQRLDRVRELTRPQFDALKALHGEITEVMDKHTLEIKSAPVSRAEVYGPWLHKAGRKGARRMLELLIERGQLTKTQLKTLAGVGRTTFITGLSWLNTNGLVEKDGEIVRLKVI